MGDISAHEAPLLSSCPYFLLREAGAHSVVVGSEDPNICQCYSWDPATGAEVMQQGAFRRCKFLQHDA